MAITRTCGSCTACCKALGVKTETWDKPPGKWCEHCSIGKGCRVYEHRPLDCQTFQCEWLKGHALEEDRPDRLGVIFDYAEGDPSLEVPAGIEIPRRLFQIWEVEEGALSSERVRVVTLNMAATGMAVLHIPLKGPGKQFRLVGPKTVRWEWVELAFTTDILDKHVPGKEKS